MFFFPYHEVKSGSGKFIEFSSSPRAHQSGPAKSFELTRGAGP